ncbi:MAG TPA: hypothetical protein VN612_03440 [Acidobacteriaceae bacterium]|nr:hypothetical protein [Acidobacteriaceae bacterium]
MPAKTNPAPTDAAANDAALAYDAWFRSEVEEALREADDPNTVWIPQEEVERRSAERRAKWQTELERRRKPA